MLVPVFDIRRDDRIGSHVFHFAFLGFARFFTHTGESGGFFLLKAGLPLAQIHFTSLPNVRRFYFSARLLARHTILQQCLSKTANILVLFALGIHSN